MKYTKTILTAACLLQLGLYSCRKQEIVKEEKGSTTAVKFAEMKTPQNFKWATNNLIHVQIQPLLNDNRKSVLKIVDASGVVYFKKLHSAKEQFSTSIEVPAHIKTMKVVFAGTQKEFSTSSNKISFNIK